MQYQEWKEANEDSLTYAHTLAVRAGELAVQKGWSDTALVTGSLAPEGGASGLAQSIANYAREQKVGLGP